MISAVGLTMSKIASLAVCSGRMRVGDGASAGSEKRCVQARLLGSNTA